MKVVSVVGTRPNFVKLFTVHRALTAAGHRHILVHTGQHFDVNMSDVIFRDLSIPQPDVHLGIEPGPPALQTARIMEALHRALPDLQPDWVVVYGDVTSTPAAALVSRLMGFRTAHVESGYRSFDRVMPEEVNRMVADQICDLLLAPDETAAGNLRAERVSEDRIRIVGSANIDALLHLLASPAPPARAHEIERGDFAVLTLHRPGNVDDPARRRVLLDVLGEIGKTMPILFPLHPRTRARMTESGDAVPPSLHVVEPMSYREFLGVIARSRAVLTDSGGLQEETAFLGVPCIVLRDTSERPALVAAGHTRLVGADPAAILGAWEELAAAGFPRRPYRDQWTDGRAGERIVAALVANR